MQTNTIGKNMRKYRRALHLSQEQLAEQTELSPNFISMLECGRKKPSLDALIAIINALHVSANALLCDEEEAAVQTKACELSERLDKLPLNDRKIICQALEMMIRSAENEG